MTVSAALGRRSVSFASASVAIISALAHPSCLLSEMDGLERQVELGVLLFGTLCVEELAILSRV